MELFLREQMRLSAAERELRRPFESRFLEAEYLALYLARRAKREKNPETILGFEDSGDVAKVTTSGPGNEIPKRYRYHIRRSAIGWQICEREWECIVCHGTGVLSDTPCEACNGTGWKDSLKG
jgi:hypothetical protein